ncbi:hypothetical protein Tco_0158718 [Tanacetum coccineum]
MDEQWFNLNQDTLRDALQITPVDNNRAFSSPPTPDTLVEFVNELGYPKEVVHLSNVTTNDMFQPWRALATIINLCLTGEKLLDLKAVVISSSGLREANEKYFGLTIPYDLFNDVNSQEQTTMMEPDTGKLQPLPEVPGKGKEKVGEEQAAQVLLNLPNSKEEEPRHIRCGTKEKARLDQTLVTLMKPGWYQSLVPNEARLTNLMTVTLLNLLPLTISNGFNGLRYPDVHKNLKLTVDEQVIPEEPVSSTGTLSSLQHLAKDFSFGDQFLNDKPSEADNEKTTADTEAESMASVTIQQDTSISPSDDISGDRSVS